ncbi:hypothetical protein TrRE_jg12511, partial [Triparma retinervis]
KAARERREQKDHSACFKHFASSNHTHSSFSSLSATSIVTRGTYDPRDLVSSLSSRTSKICSFRNPSGINATAEELYKEGYKQACQQVKSPPPSTAVLRNVPISVKDCIGVRGCLQTGGLAVRTLERHRSPADSALVATLRSEGAIPIVRGNVSQCMMLPESANNVWGESLNPWDKTRTPGGSSGGEGALVAAGCVPLAVGSDVGGSLNLAYFKTDGWFHPCEAALRGLEETVDALRKEGHTVEEVKFPGSGADAYELYVKLAAAEGDMRCFHEGLEGEHYDMEFIPDKQRDHWARKAAEQMKDSEGLPLSVAVMTPLWRDEECLRIMKEVERVMGFEEKPQDYLD